MSTALGLIAAGVIPAEEPVPSSQVQLETQGSFSDGGVNSYNKANDAKVLKLRLHDKFQLFAARTLQL